MTESPKLLPCPWCGDHPSSMRADAWDGTRKIGCARIWCPTCCSDKASVALTPDLAYEQSAEAWNRRAPDPEREAMAKVCEAAQARMDTYDKGEDYTGGIKSVEWNNLRAALADLERARKEAT